jgi:hypothetical protein
MFHVGQRVRRTAHGRNTFLYDRSHTGVVTAVDERDGYGGVYVVFLKVHRDGLSRPDGPYHHDFWEPVPPGDLSADDAARALALAVLRGDAAAARALHDRLTEIYAGG